MMSIVHFKGKIKLNDSGGCFRSVELLDGLRQCRNIHRVSSKINRQNHSIKESRGKDSIYTAFSRLGQHAITDPLLPD